MRIDRYRYQLVSSWWIGCKSGTSGTARDKYFFRLFKTCIKLTTTAILFISLPIHCSPRISLLSSTPIIHSPQSPMDTPNGVDLSSQLVMKLNLDLRGHSFVVERDQLMNLPESVLLCLFPNGLVLSRPPNTSDDEDEEEDDIYYVDVSRSASCTLSRLTPLSSTQNALITCWNSLKSQPSISTALRLALARFSIISHSFLHPPTALMTRNGRTNLQTTHYSQSKLSLY